ncbi:hypothetical protein ADUPG1_010819 [Aduncisulcus paluster]|uniref:Uncharacterized protein n=1 Tax=Aduncisulcus paluster TaxID=2918883 RepID=A0ABQ5JSX2_9EUKA|nr:hypothetical protein ADUPG1_010819 [Aduncisulcus paluster]
MRRHFELQRQREQEEDEKRKKIHSNRRRRELDREEKSRLEQIELERGEEMMREYKNAYLSPPSRVPPPLSLPLSPFSCFSPSTRLSKLKKRLAKEMGAVRRERDIASRRRSENDSDHDISKRRLPQFTHKYPYADGQSQNQASTAKARKKHREVKTRERDYDTSMKKEKVGRGRERKKGSHQGNYIFHPSFYDQINQRSQSSRRASGRDNSDLWRTLTKEAIARGSIQGDVWEGYPGSPVSSSSPRSRPLEQRYSEGDRKMKMDPLSKEQRMGSDGSVITTSTGIITDSTTGSVGVITSIPKEEEKRRLLEEQLEQELMEMDVHVGSSSQKSLLSAPSEHGSSLGFIVGDVKERKKKGSGVADSTRYPDRSSPQPDINSGIVADIRDHRDSSRHVDRGSVTLIPVEMLKEKAFQACVKRRRDKARVGCVLGRDKRGRMKFKIPSRPGTPYESTTDSTSSTLSQHTHFHQPSRQSSGTPPIVPLSEGSHSQFLLLSSSKEISDQWVKDRVAIGRDLAREDDYDEMEDEEEESSEDLE